MMRQDMIVKVRHFNDKRLLPHPRLASWAWLLTDQVEILFVGYLHAVDLGEGPVKPIGWEQGLMKNIFHPFCAFIPSWDSNLKPPMTTSSSLPIDLSTLAEQNKS